MTDTIDTGAYILIARDINTHNLTFYFLGNPYVIKITSIISSNLFFSSLKFRIS